VSIGQGSGEIETGWTDGLITWLLEHFRFDHTFNVPLGGGSSPDGNVLYLDKAIPINYVQRNDARVPAWRYLCVHEGVEKMLLDNGVPYLPAHACATAIELACVADDKFDVAQYDTFWNAQLKVAAQHKLGDGTPPDIEMAPYEEN